MKNKLSILIAVLIAAFATVSVSAQVTNGSFENGNCVDNNFSGFVEMLAADTNIDSWTVGGGVDYICSYWTAADVVRSVDLNGRQPGSVSQAFATTPGFTYQVTFSMSGNPDGSSLSEEDPLFSPPIKTLGVSANGSTPQNYSFDTSVAGNSLGDMRWVSKTYTFTATGATSTLTFASQIVGAFGPALDKVAVTATTGYICHHDRGKPVAKTLIVGLDSIPSHIAQHGDTAGPCNAQ